ncbi:unnamed protein product, partial [Cyprideis torosa]
GATLDEIAAEAGLSKPNIIYYYDSKDAIYKDLLESQLDSWLDPLREIDENGSALDEILTYARRKLAMSRDMPRESRLFATEVIQTAPHIGPVLGGSLKELVDEVAMLFTRWMDEGKIARVDPHHLIFSIWAMTQHYADFDVQVRAVLGPDKAKQRFQDAEVFISHVLHSTLAPKA